MEPVNNEQNRNGGQREAPRETSRVVAPTISLPKALYLKVNLQEPEPLAVLNALGITYETYKLALIDDLLNAIFFTPGVRADLTNNRVSGYLSGPALATRFGAAASAGQYWTRSGVAGFQPDAAQHFHLPERYIDLFDNVTTLKFDRNDLYIERSSDPLGNTVTVEAFDFRVLAPRQLKDINDATGNPNPSLHHRATSRLYPYSHMGGSSYEASVRFESLRKVVS